MTKKYESIEKIKKGARKINASQERAIFAAYGDFKDVKGSVFYEKNLQANPSIFNAVQKNLKKNKDEDSEYQQPTVTQTQPANKGRKGLLARFQSNAKAKGVINGGDKMRQSFASNGPNQRSSAISINNFQNSFTNRQSFGPGQIKVAQTMSTQQDESLPTEEELG